MKNLKLVCLMAITGLFLFLGGCQKDEANYNLKGNESKIKRRFEIDPSLMSEEGLQSKNFIIDQPSLHRKVVKSFNSLNTRSGLFKLSDIQFTGYAEVNDSVRTVFSFILKTDLKDRFFHYVIEKEQNNNIREYVLEIKPSNFLSFDGDMTNFTGTISKISFNEAFNTVYDPATGRGDEHFEIIYCWKLLFENGIDKNIFNDPNSQTGSPDYGGGGGGGKYTLVCVPCTCKGHTCSESCKCSNRPYYKLVPKKDKIKNNNESGTRSDVEECYRLLITVGIISPPAGVGGQTDTNSEEGIITNQLGVSQECMNKLDKSARLALAEMMKKSNLISPCDPSKSSNEILGEEIQSLCTATEGKVTSDMLKNSLSDGGYVSKEQYEKLLEMFEGYGLNSSYLCDENVIENILGGNGFDLCKSSFDNYTVTGFGTTIEFTCNKTITIIADFRPFENIDYIYECNNIQDLCITTGTYELDKYGNVIVDNNGIAVEMGMNTRKELTALAYDAARHEIADENLKRHLNGQNLLTEVEANNLFKTTLILELKKRMTGVAVSSGPCNGTIKKGRPNINVFGVCIPQACKC